jgi:epidermal growth factor receptor
MMLFALNLFMNKSTYSFNLFIYSNFSIIVCVGTSNAFSSSYNEYNKWVALYKNCIYVDGNLEITNFHPFYEAEDGSAAGDDVDIDSPDEHNGDSKLDQQYDFSFLDNIREITGYLLIHSNRIKSLRFKNLKIVRGKNLIASRYSVFIGSNYRLESLDLSNLTGNF